MKSYGLSGIIDQYVPDLQRSPTQEPANQQHGKEG